MAPVTDPSIVSLLEEFQESRLKKNWSAMRELLHSEARLESLAAVGSVLSADELVEAVRGATAHGLYAVKKWRVESLGQHAALADGRIRYQVQPGAITDEPRVWISTERDGLIWRMRIFRDRDAATGCIRAHGLTLGLAAAAPD